MSLKKYSVTFSKDFDGPACKFKAGKAAEVTCDEGAAKYYEEKGAKVVCLDKKQVKPNSVVSKAGTTGPSEKR